MHLVDRSKGVMVGLACGDALGALVEYIPQAFKHEYKEITEMKAPLPLELLINKASSEITLNHLQRYIDYMCLPGLYTDDTQQAILVAESLINNQGVNQENIAELYVKGARLSGYGDFGIFRHAGPGFKESVKNLMMFKPINTCGVISAGNGAAMRIAPLGIYYKDNVDKLLRATIDISMITHRDIRGIAAAGLISFTVAYLINKTWDSLNISHLCSELKSFINEMENIIATDYATISYNSVTKHQVSNSMLVLQEIRTSSYEASIASLDKLAKQTSGYEQCFHNSPYVLGSVLYSLYLFISQGYNWEQAVLTAVNGGGDTDTIAAMVSAMCGAIHGFSLIPLNWTNNIMNLDSLESLGESLITSHLIAKNFLEIEKQLCKNEMEYRNKFRKILHNALGFK